MNTAHHHHHKHHSKYNKLKNCEDKIITFNVEFPEGDTCHQHIIQRLLLLHQRQHLSTRQPLPDIQPQQGRQQQVDIHIRRRLHRTRLQQQFHQELICHHTKTKLHRLQFKIVSNPPPLASSPKIKAAHHQLAHRNKLMFSLAQLRQFQ